MRPIRVATSSERGRDRRRRPLGGPVSEANSTPSPSAGSPEQRSPVSTINHENESVWADRFINVVGLKSRNGRFFRHAHSAYQLYIERTDATKTGARSYALAIEPTLFGTPCLTRRWGASGHGASLRQGRGCCA
nr:WGR domain-containing protein [Sinorhizobium meliloti]